MLSLEELVSRIVPARTALVLGAGVGVPSGAPTGAGLARMLAVALDGKVISDDLAETASILENRHTRSKLIREVRRVLEPLAPTGGLLALPHLPWKALYSTNFDLLVERSYKRAGKRIIPVRSNFEYSRPDEGDAPALFKVHGCISQDVTDGATSGLTLTEGDYLKYADYREALFQRLGLALATGDVLIIGQSLQDPHLRSLLNEATKLRDTKGAQGRTFALVFDRDADRAGLIEGRGIEVAFGSIDEFTDALGNKVEDATPEHAGETETDDGMIPWRAVSATTVVDHARQLAESPTRLFNGAAASYADVRAALTFDRDCEARLLQSVVADGNLATTVLGAGGVGKTTVARRVLSALQEQGVACWEHRSEFPLHRLAWQEVEQRLRSAGRRGVLLVDDCPRFLNQINTLLERLDEIAQPALHVIVTANAAEWRPRMKSKLFFSKGRLETIEQLSTSEIERLLNLMYAEPRIADLAQSSFRAMSRNEQAEVLRRRCSADMFVCLKNIFESDALDSILLREYAGLEPALQDIYRHVSVIEATGGQVHRQLILRLLGIDADTIAHLLALLEGVVDEFDIKPSEGIYGWSTRHRVIARVIARYKYAEDEERRDFLTRIVDAANPSVRIERDLLREICGREYGIGSLQSALDREALLRRVIARAPGERVPRHRLIALLLRERQFEEADRAIAAARDQAGWDPPLARYQIRVAVLRAADTVGIMDEDRRAILLEAERLAVHAVTDFPRDKYAYRSYLDVGASYARLTGDSFILEAAFRRASEAFDDVLDPVFGDILKEATAELRKYGL